MNTTFKTTPEQDGVFLDAYLSNGGDAVAACIEARIDDSAWPITVTAKVMLQREDIQSALQAMKASSRRTNTEITRASIVADMQSVFEIARTSGDPKAMIAAKRLQAEMLQLLDQNVNINIKHDVTALSMEELQKIAAAGIVEGDFTEVKTVGALVRT